MKLRDVEGGYISYMQPWLDIRWEDVELILWFYHSHLAAKSWAKCVAHTL